MVFSIFYVPCPTHPPPQLILDSFSHSAVIYWMAKCTEPFFFFYSETVKLDDRQQLLPQWSAAQFVGVF